MATASEAQFGSSWANKAQAPGVVPLDPVELPFIKQDYQRYYSNNPNAVPIVGATEFVLDQWGEEIYWEKTYQSKYKYNLKLTALPGNDRQVDFIGF